MVSALQSRNLLDSTTIIVTAKHGQSPIDPKRFFPIPGHSGTNGTSPANLLNASSPTLKLQAPDRPRMTFPSYGFRLGTPPYRLPLYLTQSGSWKMARAGLAR